MKKDMCGMPASFARKCAQKRGYSFERFESYKENMSVSGTVFTLAVPFFVCVRGIGIVITACAKKLTSVINEIIRLISGAIGIRKKQSKCPNILKYEKCR